MLWCVGMNLAVTAFCVHWPHLSEQMRLVTDLHIPSDGCDMASIHARPLASVSTSRIKRTLAGLSLSELTVLVSLKHALTEQETFNMTMALQSYRNHLKRQPTSQKGLNHGSFAKVRWASRVHVQVLRVGRAHSCTFHS